METPPSTTVITPEDPPPPYISTIVDSQAEKHTSTQMISLDRPYPRMAQFPRPSMMGNQTLLEHLEITNESHNQNITADNYMLLTEQTTPTPTRTRRIFSVPQSTSDSATNKKHLLLGLGVCSIFTGIVYVLGRYVSMELLKNSQH